MLDSPSASAPLFSLAEDQIAVRDMARAFAAKVFAPHAVAWDEAKHFPVAEMRQAAELGMGGVYIAADVGGSALSRLDATLIFEALGHRLSHRVGLYVDPQYGRLDDRRLRFGRTAPKVAA